MSSRRIWKFLLRKLREKGIRLEAVGLQSHMHQRKWSFDETWEICERYAKYGWPIHFTELTVINGRCTKDVDYTIGNPNFWISRPEDLEIQREYTEQLYTLLFSILRWRLLPGGISQTGSGWMHLVD